MNDAHVLSNKTKPVFKILLEDANENNWPTMHRTHT